MTSTISTTSEKKRPDNDEEFDGFLAQFNYRFLTAVDNGKKPVFTTDAEGLWEAYLDAAPEGRRQHYNCNACRRFIEKYGALVTIDENGRTESVMWQGESATHPKSGMFAAMKRIVAKAKVTGVFLSSEKVWGIHQTGEWTHLAITPAPSMVFKSLVKTAEQAMAEKREDHGQVARGLADYKKDLLEQALKLLNSEQLYRSEKVIGPAKWLHSIHEAWENNPKSARGNLLWRFVATAPAGFCHPRSSMIATLLDDLAAGKSFATVSRNFSEKMHPLQYQRPTSAPSEGNISQAEKLIEKLNAAGALSRRFARLDEIQSLWTPRPAKPPKSAEGVFGHLKASGGKQKPADLRTPPVTMTWEKFQRTILPNAARITYTPHAGPQMFTALVTAVDSEAPPILQWDREDQRNPVSWYLWHGGSLPRQFNLTSGTPVDVKAVTLLPSMWNDPEGKFSHQGRGVIFLLDGARETKLDAGNALFPEILRSDLHGVRKTLEAFSKGKRLEGENNPENAAGLILQTSGNARAWNADFCVYDEKGLATTYRLDRWD